MRVRTPPIQIIPASTITSPTMLISILVCILLNSSYRTRIMRTRMHSSRMRTERRLTAWGVFPEGWDVSPGCVYVCVSGGMCVWVQGCLQGGVGGVKVRGWGWESRGDEQGGVQEVCPDDVQGVYPGGVDSRGVSRGVCPGGCVQGMCTHPIVDRRLWKHKLPPYYVCGRQTSTDQLFQRVSSSTSTVEYKVSRLTRPLPITRYPQLGELGDVGSDELVCTCSPL